MSKQRRAGIILSYAGQAVQILTSLFYTPLMLRLLGQSEYGLYQLVNSIVSNLSLLSLGFNAAYMRFYSREKANDNSKGIAKLNGMFIVIFMTIAFICLACGETMVRNVHTIFGSGLSKREYSQAVILMRLLILNMAISFPNSVFSSIITAQERFVFQKSIILLQYILNPFLALPVLLMGYGSVGMVLVATVLTIAALVSNLLYCFHTLHIKFDFSNFDLKLLREMWGFTFFIFINQIIDQVNWSVDKILLGRIAGTTSVAVYGIGSQINNMYIQLSTSISNVFVPKVNRLVAEHRNDSELTSLFSKVGRIQYTVLMLILTGFIFFGKPFIALWAGKGYEEAYFVAILLIMPVTIPLIQNIGIEIQRAKDKHKARSIVYLVIAVANVMISVPLIHFMGSIGAALGTTLSLLVGNGLFMNWYYQHRIGIDIGFFWKRIIQVSKGLILPVLFGLAVRKTFENSSWGTLIVGIMLYAIVYCVSMFFLGMNRDEKARVSRPNRKARKQ